MLRTVINKNTVFEPLSLVIGITERKSLMPYLSNVLIRFGQRPYIYSTDLDISAIAFFDHETDTEESLVVNGRKFFDILKELDKGELTLASEGGNLIISQGKTEFMLTLYDPDEFPEVSTFSPDVKFAMEGSDFLDLLRSVSFAMGTDESRYVLTGVFIKGEEGRLTIVATDGYRMALKRKSVENLPAFSGFIVPAKTVRELERVVSEEESVTIEGGKTGIAFRTNRLHILSRVLEGQYPDYESAIPRYNRLVVKVERGLLYKGLKRVSAIMSRNEPVLLRVVGTILEISSESEAGRAKEVIEVSYGGQMKQLHLNGRFFLEAISHTRGDVVTMKLPEEHGALLVHDGDGEDYLNVIMPIRV